MCYSQRWLMAVVLILQWEFAQAQSAKVTLDPPPLKVGEALSARTLVQKPPPLRDVGSWTIETMRHRGYASVAALSPDEKLIATGGLDGIVRLWDTSNGEFVRALVGHGYYVYGLAWSPDGKYLATSGSYDYTVRIWETSSWQPVRLMKGFDGYTHFLAWSPNGRTLAIAGGSPSGFIWCWDVDRPAARQKIGTGNYTYGIAWSPDLEAPKLAAASAGNSVVIYNTDVEKFESQFELPNMVGYSVTWSPDGKLVACGGAGPTTIWDVASKEKRHELATAAATTAAWSPDGKTLAVGFGSGTAFWESPFDAKEPTHTAGHAPRTIAWTKDNQVVYLLESARIVKWNVAEKKSVATFDIGGDNYVNWVPGRPIISSLHSNSPELWDPTTGKSIAKLVHEGAASAAAWSRDGKQLATAGSDKKVRLWDATGKLTKTLEGHEGPVTCAAWGNGSTLATGSTDMKVRVWELNDKSEKVEKSSKSGGDKTRILTKHTDAVNALAWSRDGRLLASGGREHNVYIWSGDSEKLSAEIPTPAVQSLAWAPNGKFLAVGETIGDVDILAFPGGKKAHTFELSGSPPNVNSLAWSADGNILLSGRGDHRFQIWKGSDTKPMHNITSMSPVLLGVWCFDNKTIAISGHDRTVRIVDAPTGTLEGVAIVGTNQVMIVSTTGHYKVADEAESELVCVVQTAKGQETLSPKDFAARFKWKNLSTQAKLPPK